MNGSELGTRAMRVASVVLLVVLLILPSSFTPASLKAAPAGPPELRYIDVHAHLLKDWEIAVRQGGSPPPPGTPPCSRASAVASALSVMDQLGIEQSVIMPTANPDAVNFPCDHESLTTIVSEHPDRVAFLGGAATLMPLFFTNGTASEFEAKALAVLRDGAHGFGEMTAEHFSLQPDHPYVNVSPDHPLFLLLADIAARYDVVIDLHMEAIPFNMQFPFPQPEPPNARPNPPNLTANIEAFERLLAHNRKARIVWDHAGWDLTGQLTVDLMRRLLAAHSNLYMNIKISRSSLGSGNFLGPNSPLDPVDSNYRLSLEWLALL
ncbi:MAG: amidohydrolase family protein, partial [Armatimonadetes bacterium]|nr:amidohydrolase family protein [Armatimonadota bacterium]